MLVRCRNQYNIILTGSAFMDHKLYFTLYQQAAAGAALVEELFNCEDILMNFVVANATNSSPAILFVRPRLRIDVSFTSGQSVPSPPQFELAEPLPDLTVEVTCRSCCAGVPRLSGKTSRHRSKRDICLQQFSVLFGDSNLHMRTPDWGTRGMPQCGLARLVGCLFV
jgi:Glycosyl transferase family 64 domain